MSKVPALSQRNLDADMKKIGMIGGLSWVSTAEYYRRVNEITEERLGGVHSAHLILESVDRQNYVDAVIDHGDESAACEIILNAACALEHAGASFIVICCNDVHRFVPEIEPEISTPILHIAEATSAAVEAANIGKVGLLGVRKTMDGDFYPGIFGNHGIATIVPNEGEKAFVHDSIYSELVRNIFSETTRRRYIDIIRALTARGAEGVVLGCTEIPLLLQPDDVDIPTFSTTEIHCQAAVDLALKD